MTLDHFVAWRQLVLGLPVTSLTSRVNEAPVVVDYLDRAQVLELVRALEMVMRAEAKAQPAPEPQGPPGPIVQPTGTQEPVQTVQERLVVMRATSDVTPPPAVLLASVETPPDTPQPAVGLPPATPPISTGSVDEEALSRVRRQPGWTVVPLLTIEGKYEARYEIGDWRFTESPLKLVDGEELVIMDPGVGRGDGWLYPDEGVLSAPPWDPNYPRDVHQIIVKVKTTSGVPWKARIGLYRQARSLTATSAETLSRVRTWN